MDHPNQTPPNNLSTISTYQPVFIAVFLMVLILKSIQLSDSDIIKSISTIPAYQVGHYKNIFVNLSEFEEQAMINDDFYEEESEDEGEDDEIDEVDSEDEEYDDQDNDNNKITLDSFLKYTPNVIRRNDWQNLNNTEKISFSNLLKAKITSNGEFILPEDEDKQTQAVVNQENQEQVQVFEEDRSKTLARSENRVKILRNYCENIFKIEHPLNKLKLQPGIRLHKMIYSSGRELEEKDEDEEEKDNEESDKIIGKPFTYCLPLKTGTTNWQKSFVKNYKPDINEKFLDPPFLFKLLYRVSDIKDFSFRRKVLNQTYTNDLNQTILGLNVRHPFARLYSAYHQKFEIKYYRKYLARYKIYGKKMKEIDEILNLEDPKRFATLNYSSKYVASFEAFLRLIALQKLDRYFNAHWQSIRYTCQPCYINYNFISHAETSTEDSLFILNKIFKEPRTESISGPYDKKQHKVRGIFEKLDKSLVDEIYEIYKDDFLMFGYSLEDDY